MSSSISITRVFSAYCHIGREIGHVTTRSTANLSAESTFVCFAGILKEVCSCDLFWKKSPSGLIYRNLPLPLTYVIGGFFRFEWKLFSWDLALAAATPIIISCYDLGAPTVIPQMSIVSKLAK
jgi:hypothetical protein